ncbi:MAG: hypothetical protein EBY74_07090 [Actinobacteria bacterium]|nr:hypothetical protein [Actinomycetota bacterium]
MNRSIPSLTPAKPRGKNRNLSAIDVIAIGYRKDSKKIIFLPSKKEIGEIERSLALKIRDLFDLHSKEARGANESVDAKAGEIFLVPLAKGPSIAFYAIGSASVPDLRKAGSTLGRRFKGKGQRVHLTGPLETAFIEALILSNYSWSEKSGAIPANPSFTFDSGAINQKDLDATMVILTSLWRARDLIHTTSNLKSPAWVAGEVKKMAKGIAQLKVEVKSGKELAEFGGLRAVGGSSTVQNTTPVKTPDPTPPVPLKTSLIETPIIQKIVKTAPIDTILFDFEDQPIEIMSDLLLENIGGHELINIARNDTINGQTVTYQPIKNLTSIQQQYNPNNVVALQNTSDKYFANFSIKLETKLPEAGEGPDGAYVYIEDATGDLIIELINLETDEQIEVQISLSGTIYEAEFNES